MSNMFDKEKGTCKYCKKLTRSSSTSLCNACYKLQISIRNNIGAAKLMIEELGSKMEKDNER